MKENPEIRKLKVENNRIRKQNSDLERTLDAVRVVLENKGINTALVLISQRLEDVHNENVERLLETQEEDTAAERDRLKAQNAELVRILEAALERMEAVSERIGVEHRSEGVSQRAHVGHMAAHLGQHAKIARADLAKAKGLA